MTNSTKTKTGAEAITYSSKHGVALHKYADPTEGARDVTAAEATEIAKVDPSLIWCEAAWRITSGEGVDLGVYAGATTADALDAMARDAGYPDHAAASRESGDDGAHLRVTRLGALRVVPSASERIGGSGDGTVPTEEYETMTTSFAIRDGQHAHGPANLEWESGTGDARRIGWMFADGTRAIETNGDPVWDHEDGFADAWAEGSE